MICVSHTHIPRDVCFPTCDVCTKYSYELIVSAIHVCIYGIHALVIDNIDECSIREYLQGCRSCDELKTELKTNPETKSKESAPKQCDRTQMTQINAANRYAYTAAYDTIIVSPTCHLTLSQRCEGEVPGLVGYSFYGGEKAGID